MTDDQIRRILESNAKQSEENRKFQEEQREILAKLTKDGEERANSYGQLAMFLKNNLKTTNEKLDELSAEVKPIIDLATSVRGFDKIGMWIVKFLLGLGALIGAGGTILYFLRKLIAPNND